MTDPTPRDLDQLASDLVDGLLPPAEAARARSEPEIAARAARIEQLRSVLRTVPAASPAQVSRGVSAAVAAAAAEANPVRHLAPRRRRRRLGERARPWLAAAAVIVFAGLAMAGLMRIEPSGDEDMAEDSSSAGDHETSEQSPAGADEDAVFDAGDGGASSTTVARLSEDLGEASSPDELAALIPSDAKQTALDFNGDDTDRPTAPAEQPATSAPGAAEGTSTTCPGLSAAGDPTRGTSFYSADATYQGAPVRVHLYESADGTRLVATSHTCADVVDTAFTP